jgi:hypothetical protein
MNKIQSLHIHEVDIGKHLLSAFGSGFNAAANEAEEKDANICNAFIDYFPAVQTIKFKRYGSSSETMCVARDAVQDFMNKAKVTWKSERLEDDILGWLGM